MSHGGRRRVSVLEQRDREVKRFTKKVSKAILPSKQTQRVLTKALFSQSFVSNEPQRVYVKKKKSTLVPWNDMKPSGVQCVVCLAIAVFCTCPVFMNGNFDGSASAWLLLLLFFVCPLLCSFLIVINYNKIKSQSYSQESSETQSDCIGKQDFNKEKSSDYEIERANALVYMNEFNDALQIMQKTVNPDIFFSRFDFARGKLEKMVECERAGVKFSGSPSTLLVQFDDETNISDTVNVLVDNSYKEQIKKISELKTKRGRCNSNKRWYETFEPFFDRIPERSQNYLALKKTELEEME